jgi:FAD/FMN-containing dehydrogenase
VAVAVAVRTEIAAMRSIKTALDPQGTLNPGVLLPAV